MYVIVTIAPGSIIHVYGGWDTRHEAMTELRKMEAADLKEHEGEGAVFMGVRKILTYPIG